MRTFILFLLLTLTIVSFSQEADSTIYNIYKAKKNVTEIKYIKDYYSNGQIKQEGWIVYEKSSANSEIIEISKWDSYDIIEHRFGIWKKYYKEGQIEEIDTNGIYKNEVSKQYFYNKKGCLIKIVTVRFSVHIDKVTNRWVTSGMSDLESIDFYYYTCDGITNEEHFVNNYVRSGTWKWYKKLKVVKTKEYKDNKVVATNKY